MEYEELVEHVKSRVSDMRFSHIMNVVEVSKVMCSKYNINSEKTTLSALLHDVTKEDVDINNIDLITKLTDDELIINGKKFWHALTGAYYTEEVLKIEDSDIIEAVKYHSIGKKDMSDIAKVVLIADVIEVGRVNDKATKLRNMMLNDEISLDDLLVECCKMKRKFHTKRGLEYHKNLDEIIGDKMDSNVIIEYIMNQDEKSHEHLWEVYKILDEVLGDKTTKVISYQIPTFKAKRNVIHFAAFKNHIGIYPGSNAIDKFKDELNGYSISKGTLQVKYDQELPIVAIKKMAIFSYEQNK